MGPPHERVTVEAADVAAVRPLRHEVLRRGYPAEATRFRDDDHPLALHVAMRVHRNDGESDVVAVGTVAPEPPPWAPDHGHAWRIRGMATKDGFRGEGRGRRVLDALIAHAAGHAGSLIWCHARIGALGFYRRAGFVTTGEPFDDGVAVHQSMWRSL